MGCLIDPHTGAPVDNHQMLILRAVDMAESGLSIFACLGDGIASRQFCENEGLSPCVSPS